MPEYRWRLAYKDGRILDELPDGSSIDLAWPGAITLFVMLNEKAILQIALEGCAPIWYRRRYMDTNLKGIPLSGPKTSALVFGKGIETETEIKPSLWAIIQGRCVDCPASEIDQGVIERQTVEHFRRLALGEKPGQVLVM